MTDAGSSPRLIHPGTELSFGKLDLNIFPSLAIKTLWASAAPGNSNTETEQATAVRGDCEQDSFSLSRARPRILEGFSVALG